LSVQVRRNRSTSFACINAHRHSPTRGATGLSGGAEYKEHRGQDCYEQTLHFAFSLTYISGAVASLDFCFGLGIC
jgi:hypothetical protein